MCNLRRAQLSLVCSVPVLVTRTVMHAVPTSLALSLQHSTPAARGALTCSSTHVHPQCPTNYKLKVHNEAGCRHPICMHVQSRLHVDRRLYIGSIHTSCCIYVYKDKVRKTGDDAQAHQLSRASNTWRSSQLLLWNPTSKRHAARAGARGSERAPNASLSLRTT